MLPGPVEALDASGTQVAVPGYMVTGALAVLTLIQIRLQTLRGTWVDDVSLGMPWMDVAAGRLSSVAVEGAVRQQIGRVPGVVAIDAVRVSLTPSATLEVVVRVLDDDGSIVAARVGDVDDGSARRVGAWYLLLLDGARPVVPTG